MLSIAYEHLNFRVISPTTIDVVSLARRGQSIFPVIRKVAFRGIGSVLRTFLFVVADAGVFAEWCRRPEKDVDVDAVADWLGAFADAKVPSPFCRRSWRQSHPTTGLGVCRNDRVCALHHGAALEWGRAGFRAVF